MPMLGFTRTVYSPLLSSCLTCFMASGSNASALWFNQIKSFHGTR